MDNLKLLNLSLNYAPQIKKYAGGVLGIAVLVTIIWAISERNPKLILFGFIFGLVAFLLLFLFFFLVANARREAVRGIPTIIMVILWASALAFVFVLAASVVAIVLLMFTCQPKPLQIMLALDCDTKSTPTPTPLVVPSVKIVSPPKSADLNPIVFAARAYDENGDVLDITGTASVISFNMKWRICILDQSSSNKKAGKGFLQFQGEEKCLPIKNNDWEAVISLGHKGSLLPRNKADARFYNIRAILFDEDGYIEFSKRCPSSAPNDGGACEWENPKEAIAYDEVSIKAYVPQ